MGPSVRQCARQWAVRYPLGVADRDRHAEQRRFGSDGKRVDPIAAATDDLIRAIDLSTGKELWHAKLPAGGQANPMVYAYGGREYLVIMAGGHHFMETPAGDAVVAYALPQKTP